MKHKEKCGSEIEIIQKFTQADYKRFQDRVKATLKGKNPGEPQKEIGYEFDKNDVDKVYRS